MTVGVLAALGAGMIWGFVFIAPVIASQHTPWTLALARYTVFGVISLVFYFTLVSRDERVQLAADWAAWKSAFWLALVGNLIYYVLLSTAIQAIGVPLVTLVIGTLPIVISVCANWDDRSVRWRVLAVPCSFIAIGFYLAHEGETHAVLAPFTQQIVGFVCALGALIAWTIYPIFNSKFIKRRRDISMMAWGSLQGMALLPLTAILLVLTHYWGPPKHRIDAGDISQLLIAASVTGILSSWLGTWLWNIASERLPAALVGQLIVFETVFSLLYGFLLDQRWPHLIVWIGIVCLLAGVLFGVRAFQQERTRAAINV